MYKITYFIHGYFVGSDHAPVHLKLYIGSGGGKKTVFKWNVSYLKRELIQKIKEKSKKHAGRNYIFFYKCRNIHKLCRQTNKQKQGYIEK